jgi:hypothetical protein
LSFAEGKLPAAGEKRFEFIENIVYAKGYSVLAKTGVIFISKTQSGYPDMWKSWPTAIFLLASAPVKTGFALCKLRGKRPDVDIIPQSRFG